MIIKSTNRIIPTIGIAIVTQYPLAGGQEHVSGDKPAGLRVVVAGLQVVEARLLIVNVPPVAEGVQHAQCGCQGARAAELLSPAVIGVFYHGVPVAVNQLDNVPLAVPQAVIVGAVEVHRLDQASGVIAEPQRIVTLDEPDQHTAVVVVICMDIIFRISMVLRFLLSQAVRVVSEGIVVCPAAYTRQLLPMPGQAFAPVAGGVPHGVVDDRLIAVADQLVLPVPGGITVGDRGDGRTRVCGRGVGVDLLLRQVPPDVVGIRHRLVREGVVLPDQFVGADELVGYGRGFFSTFLPISLSEIVKKGQLLETSRLTILWT